MRRHPLPPTARLGGHHARSGHGSALAATGPRERLPHQFGGGIGAVGCNVLRTRRRIAFLSMRRGSRSAEAYANEFRTGFGDGSDIPGRKPDFQIAERANGRQNARLAGIAGVMNNCTDSPNRCYMTEHGD